jgi:hypothetical protein
VAPLAVVVLDVRSSDPPARAPSDGDWPPDEFRPLAKLDGRVEAVHVDMDDLAGFGLGDRRLHRRRDWR